MELRQRMCTHGGGGGKSAGTKLPKWATAIAYLAFSDPIEAFKQAGMQLGPEGAGIFGDMAAGFNNTPIGQLFGGGGGDGGWGDSIQATRDASKYFADNAMGNMQRSQPKMEALNDMAGSGAKDSAWYNANNDKFLAQSSKAYNNLNNLVGQGSSARLGPAGQAAMRASNNVGPDSELFKSTMSFLTPQVNAAYSSRGLGQSGAAANAVSDQGRQLANSMAERANAEKNAFLQTATGDEGVGASMYGTQMQGGTAASEMPMRIFNQMQQGLGQGIGNIGQAAGQLLQPFQMANAAQGNFANAQGMPLTMQQGIYNFLRSPLTQMMGIPSGTAQMQRASSPNGLFGDMLGVQK